MKVRKLSIVNKLMIVISAAIILCTSGLGVMAFMTQRDNLIHQAKENGKELAGSAASLIDGSQFESIQQGKEQEENAQNVYNTLSKFRDNSDIAYIYSMRKLEDGKIVFVIDTDKEDKAEIGEEYENAQDIKGIQEAFDGKIAADEEVTADQWGSYFSAYSPIYGEGNRVVGIVGVDIGVEWIEGQLASLRNIMLLLGASFVVAGLVCAFIISRNIGKNLKKLNEKVVELNNGDGDLSKYINMTSGDELEVIADNFNGFLHEIRTLVEKVLNLSDSIQEGGDTLAVTVAQNSQNVIQINNKMENLSSYMEECAANNDSAFNQLEECAESVHMLAKMTEKVTEYTNQMSEQASHAITDAREKKEQTESELAKLQERMVEAGEKAKKIEAIQEMIEQIEKIAKQTNILSMNAKISAAKAGEQGREFAIVATEVGQLSDATQSTAKQMEQAGKLAMNAVEELVQEIATVGRFIDENVRDSYVKMTEIGEQYSDSAIQINKEMEILSDGAFQINDTMTRVKQGSKEMSMVIVESAENIAQVGGTVDQVASNMNILDEMAMENKKNAEMLKESTKNYRI